MTPVAGPSESNSALNGNAASSETKPSAARGDPTRISCTPIVGSAGRTGASGDDGRQIAATSSPAESVFAVAVAAATPTTPSVGNPTKPNPSSIESPALTTLTNVFTYIGVVVSPMP